MMGRKPTLSAILKVHKYLMTAFRKGRDPRDAVQAGTRVDVADYPMMMYGITYESRAALTDIIERTEHALRRNPTTRLTPQKSVVVWLKAADKARRLLRLPVKTDISKNDLYYMTAVKIYKRLRAKYPQFRKYFVRPELHESLGGDRARIWRLQQVRDEKQPGQDPVVWDRALVDVSRSRRSGAHWKTNATLLAAVNRRYNALMDALSANDRHNWRQVATMVTRYQERRFARRGDVPAMAGMMSRLPAHLLTRTIAGFVAPKSSVTPVRHSTASSLLLSRSRRSTGASMSAVLRSLASSKSSNGKSGSSKSGSRSGSSRGSSARRS